MNASSLQVGSDIVQKSVVLFRIRQGWVLVMGLNVCQQRPGKNIIRVSIKEQCETKTDMMQLAEASITKVINTE